MLIYVTSNIYIYLWLYGYHHISISAYDIPIGSTMFLRVAEAEIPESLWREPPSTSSTRAPQEVSTREVQHRFFQRKQRGFRWPNAQHYFTIDLFNVALTDWAIPFKQTFKIRSIPPEKPNFLTRVSSKILQTRQRKMFRILWRNVASIKRKKWIIYSNPAFGHSVMPILYMFELQGRAEAKVTIEWPNTCV